MRVPVGSPPGPAGASSSFLPSPTSSRLGPEPPLSPPFPHPLCAIFQPRSHPSSDWHGRCWEATAGRDVFFFFFLFAFILLCLSIMHRAESLFHLFPVLNIYARTCCWKKKYSLFVVFKELKLGLARMPPRQTGLRQDADAQPLFQLLHVHICKYQHTCMFNHEKHSYCFDTEKHSHAHPVDAAFTRTVAALSHRTTHTKYSQHISALWGPSPFTQAGVSPRTFHTHADVLRQQRRRGGDAELLCNQPQRLIVWNAPACKSGGKK